MCISVLNLSRVAVGLATAFSIAVSAQSALAEVPVYKDPSQPVEVRVADLLSRMTLDEKIGQTNQRSVAVGMQDLGGWIPQFEQGQIGSIMNVSSPEVAD